MEKLGVLAKFKISHDIKDLNAAGDGGADEELVSFGRELNALPDALGVHRVEQSRGLGCDVNHGDAVVVDAESGGHSHFAVGMKCKALQPVGSLFDDTCDLRLFQREVGDKHITEITTAVGSALANESESTVPTDAEYHRGRQQCRLQPGLHFYFTQMPDVVAFDGVPLNRGRFGQGREFSRHEWAVRDQLCGN